ncbi:DUF4175 domain-containing protein [Celeribacter baekdonensis]|uniref:DUF4175 domain-containing protein n=1 Tax=Celeribacter baekdonensis TaxID=875171 RepID=UPI0030D8A2A6|tara:strand:- start:128039 stop:130594 length:2556 start_codon:yes stop_codon:yes gene_type:complete
MGFDQEKRTLELNGPLARRVRLALTVTAAGLWLERIGQAFWPFFSILVGFCGVALLGLHDLLPALARTLVLAGVAMALVASLGVGLWRFRRPARRAALARVDATLPGQPLQALTDTPLVGADDPASNSLWTAHRARMLIRLNGIRAVGPTLRLSAADPYALRLMALTVLGMGGLFGSLEQARTTTDLGRSGPDIAAGPNWEGWVQPPAYSGKPTLYLGDLKDEFDVPKGSTVTVRFYGEAGVLTLSETVSGEPITGTSAAPDFAVRQPGEIEIDGPTGRLWDVALQPDAAPTAELIGAMTRAPSGETRQNFRLTDDFGVTRAVLTITRDPEAVEKRYGYVLPPEDRPALEVSVPLPQIGDRREIEGMIGENLAQHPFAGLPVQISLTAWDEAGQASEEAIGEAILPTRRFFDPLAAALIDVRQELLWNRENAARAAQVIRAVTVDPTQLFDDMRHYFRVREVVGVIEGREGTLSDAQLTDVAGALWEIALLLEDGQLKDALERLHRAQERLSQAMRDGATPEEIQKLMQELREATRDYMQQLAEQQGEQGDGTDMPDQGQQDGQQITGDQLQQLMDRIQELMEQGRMAEAQQLLDMLAEMLENMRVTQSEGQGQGGEGMQGLQDMLRDQQQLNDDTFSDLQEQFGGGQPRGERGEQGDQGESQTQGEQPQTGEGQDGKGQGTEPNGQSLAERQQALRDQLARQRQSLNGAGGGDEEGLGGALDRADRAMDEAEEALGQNDLSGALDSQAEAMEALREGMRQLGDQQAQSQQEQEGQQGEAGGQSGSDPMRRDPLGRAAGDTGRFGSDEQLYEGEDVYRRAEELTDEIRRRSAEQDRPEDERDYLNRLLDRF